MAKGTFVHTNNLSSGELSPAMSARTELAQYRNGAREMLNMIPLVEGGAKRRDGTRNRGTFTMPDGYGTSARLIPFVVRIDRSFVLLFKPGSLIIHDANDGLYGTILTSPFTADDIPNIKYVQNRYSMWLVCGDKPVYWLRCSSDFTAWSLEQFAFDVPPLDEVVDTPDVALKPSGIDYGAVIDLVASSFAQWIGGKPYFVGDKVSQDAKAYQCLINNTDHNPWLTGVEGEPAYWVEIPDADADIFDASIVGKMIFINSGVVRVSEFIDGKDIKAEVIKKLSADVQAIAKSWSLKSSAFTAELGYPKTVTYFKQRLVFAATKTYPNMIWFSRVGDVRNFLPTTDDADSIYVATFSDQRDEIAHLSQSRGVVALTGGSEFSIDSESTMTPTTVRILEHTFFGCSRVRPCRVGNELLFVQRGGMRVRAMAYRYEVDSLVSPDISTLSKHIAEQHGGIVEITYQQEPHSIVWCVLADGKVASLTLNREQEVVAWAKHDFGGKVVSMCSVTTTQAYDSVYMLVQRRNQFANTDELVFEDMVEGLRLDSSSLRPFTGGDDPVLIRAADYAQDNLRAYQGNMIVHAKPFDDNYIRLNIDEAGEYYVGLNFTSRLDLYPPELGQFPATTRTSKAKPNRITFALMNTPALNYNGKKLEFRTFAENLFEPSAGFTGLYGEDMGDFADLNDLKSTLEQSEPLPMYVQAVIFDITVNDR